MTVSNQNNNSAKGRNSFDITVGDQLVHFFNRNVTPYPTEVSSPSFDLVPVQQRKDLMVNAARMHAKQEYDRIMELVSVLQKQAQDIKKRLEITDLIHSAQYSFQLSHGSVYWLLFDSKDNCSRLSLLGPNDWSTASPAQYNYICQVKWLGDYTWVEVDNEQEQ